ncbi:hypothetical protein OESDEN_17085 [Oesophagostomum dentatum]|uniref:Uncharacterized protein n=1 Tax=Oesophagostomum dentatum TaxID=61180 RepID=A0A0B1SD55_OESDE|nr:hypothetical protein OESDEN_17085 [Oesophagostomum dentatum]
MDPVETGDDYDYDDTTETTLSLYSLAPTESDNDFYDMSSLEDGLSYSDMEVVQNGLEDLKCDYAQKMSTTSESEDEGDISDEDCQTARSFGSVGEVLNTAFSNIDANTAMSEISIYSQYTPAPSETNVEIEYDIIAGASPMSTAVGGSISWYSMPDSETDIEIQPPLYIGGARVADSLECIRKLPDSELRPVEDFGDVNVRYLGSGVLKTPSEIEEEQYDYSYYSDGPSETNVSMEGVELFGGDNETEYKDQKVPEMESLPVKT